MSSGTYKEAKSFTPTVRFRIDSNVLSLLESDACAPSASEGSSSNRGTDSGAADMACDKSSCVPPTPHTSNLQAD